MKLRYISKNKRRYLNLGKEFPNKKDDSLNEIEVDDNYGKLLLCERVGSLPLWQEVKARRVKVEENQEVI
jgi:hypothetical protein